MEASGKSLGASGKPLGSFWKPVEAFGKPENALCRPKVLKKELKTRCAALGFCGDSGGGTGVLDLKYTYEEIGLGFRV